MKQIVQNYSSGNVVLTEVPVPACLSNTVIVQNAASLISIGTERSIVELGKQSLLGKARQRPDLVKRFIEKAKNEGLLKTFQEAMGRLDTPTLLGYSSAGTVIEVGDQVHELSTGDRVACVGAGYASHAEYIRIPPKLCAKLPEDVPFDEAAFGMLGVIAMHGIRSAKLTPGETVAVIGLGLLGLVSVQILNAYGHKTIGYDLDSRKSELALELGADYAHHQIENFRSTVYRQTSGYGADSVIITAAAKNSEVVDLAVDISRFAGRVVVVGVADIHPNRNELWHKEVEIVVSRAAGPGSLDPVYENKGIDFPPGFVRWTEQRNLSEFVYLLSKKRVALGAIVSHRLVLDQAEQTYDDILANRNGPHIGVVIEYGAPTSRAVRRTVEFEGAPSPSSEDLSVGVIGAGLFGKALLLPTVAKTPQVHLHTLCTSTGAQAHHAADKYGFRACTTDYLSLLDNSEMDAAIILTPHRLHARMVVEAINRGKHVFVEKPLCISVDELSEIRTNYESHSTALLVGYNRRFSPHATQAKAALQNRSDPLVISYRINAGFIPPDHWTHSEEEGRSRIVGEMGHFIDMIQYLSDSLVLSVYAERVSGNNRSTVNADNIVAALRLADGSVASLLYSASGDRSYPRELIEVHGEGKTIVIDDYKTTRFYVPGHRKRFSTRNQQMGYREELRHFTQLCLGTESPKLGFEEIWNSTLTTFKLEESIAKGARVEL